MRKLLAAALAAFPFAVLPARADQLLGQPRIDNGNRVQLPGGPTLGTWDPSGKKFTSRPDALQIQGGGSTGDVSKMNVTPSGIAGGSALDVLLANAPQISGGLLSLLNGPTLGQWQGGKFLSYSDGRYTNRQLTWPNTYLPGFPPHPDYVTDYVVAPAGQNTARLSATRMSDIATAGIQNTIATTALLVADSTDNQKLGWARYTQVNVTVGSAVGLVLGEENSIENLSAYSVRIDPFSDVGVGSRVTANLRLTSGTGRPANDISAFLQLLNNGGARSLAGIVIGSNALNTDGGFAAALAMPPNVGLSWYNGAGSIGWRMFQNSNAGSGTILLGNNAFDVYIGSNGEHPLSIATGQIYLNNPITLGGVVTLKNYGASTLPACANDVNRGSVAFIADAPSGYTYRQAVAGGGTTRAPVFCTGGGWEFH